MKVQKTPVEFRLDAIRPRYRAKLLPDNLGYSAWVDSLEEEYGTCWGDTREDALRALDLWLFDNHASSDVMRAM